MREVPGFVEFHAGAASFPWRSQAEWIGQQMAARLGLDRAAAGRAARGVFRSDLHREALAGTTADLPGASAGRLILRPDGFFDGRVFDPEG